MGVFTLSWRLLRALFLLLFLVLFALHDCADLGTAALEETHERRNRTNSSSGGPLTTQEPTTSKHETSNPTTGKPTENPTSAPTATIVSGPDFMVYVATNATGATPAEKSGDISPNVDVKYIVKGDSSGRLATLSNPAGYISILPTKKGCSFDLNASHILNDSRADVRDTAAAYGCSVATNAGFFDPASGACLGSIISRARIAQQHRRQCKVWHHSQRDNRNWLL